MQAWAVNWAFFVFFVARVGRDALAGPGTLNLQLLGRDRDEDEGEHCTLNNAAAAAQSQGLQ